MRITAFFLADSAQSVGGKLFVLGGGWSITGPPGPFALVALVEYEPGDDLAGPYDIQFDLQDAAGGRPDIDPFPGSDPTAERQVTVGARLEDVQVGTEALPDDALTVPIAINLPPLSLRPDRRYRWQISVNGEAQDEWIVRFRTRPSWPLTEDLPAGDALEPPS